MTTPFHSNTFEHDFIVAVRIDVVQRLRPVVRYRHEMSDEDHESLAEVLHTLRGAVLISGYRSALYDRLYRGWRKVQRHAHADGAKARIEVLWMSPNCIATQTGMAL